MSAIFLNHFSPFSSAQHLNQEELCSNTEAHVHNLEAKMQIKKNLLLSCVSHQQRWGYCQGSDATINLASQARKQLSPWEFVKILSLTLLGFVVCSRLECSSCGTGDVWALWHKGLFQQPVLLSMGEGLCLPLPRRGKQGFIGLWDLSEERKVLLPSRWPMETKCISPCTKPMNAQPRPQFYKSLENCL